MISFWDFANIGEKRVIHQLLHHCIENKVCKHIYVQKAINSLGTVIHCSEIESTTSIEQTGRTIILFLQVVCS
jgi:hypothetical protein